MVSLQELRLAGVVAAAGGLLVAGGWLGWRLAQPGQAPVAMAPRPAHVEPSATPTPAPQAHAGVVGRARVIIERPAARHPVAGQSEAPHEAWGERIIVETEVAASAEVAQPTPAPSAAAIARSPLGVVVGTMPGRVGASWQLMEAQAPLPGAPSLGLSAIAGPESAGLAGTLGQDALAPGLRLQVGAAQAYREPLGPVPFVGLGIRF